MNKFLLAFGLAALLAGCDKPAENTTVTPQNELNQPVPAAPATPTSPTTPNAPATQDNAVTNQQPAPDDTANTADTTTVAPPATATQPDQTANGQTANPNQANTEVIDASSEEAMTASLDRMIVNLSESEKEAFAEAFLVYAMSKVDMSLDEETNQKNMLAALNGKSVQDILDEAEKIKANDKAATPPRTAQK